MLALHHCRIFSFFAALLLVPLYISAGPVVTEITPYFGPSDGG